MSRSAQGVGGAKAIGSGPADASVRLLRCRAEHDARLAAVAPFLCRWAPPRGADFSRPASAFRRGPSPAVVVPYSRNSRRLPTGDSSSDTSLWKILVAICR